MLAVFVVAVDSWCCIFHGNLPRRITSLPQPLRQDRFKFAGIFLCGNFPGFERRICSFEISSQRLQTGLAILTEFLI